VFFCIATLFFFLWSTTPLITTPYTVTLLSQQDVRSETPGRVYIRGVFRDGHIATGEDVTYRIDAEELVALLAQVQMHRWPSVSRAGGVPEHQWSIYWYQDRDLHLRLGHPSSVAESRRNGVRVHNISVHDAEIIMDVLERMVAAHE